MSDTDSVPLFHPGAALAFWLSAVLGSQRLESALLPWILALVLLTALGLAGSHLRVLLRRVRWLLLAVVVLFGFFTPGEALWLDLPWLSPSREGLGMAFDHAARIVLVVCAVALLFRWLGSEALVEGLYALARPLAAIGFPPERFAVRMLLVLRYVESAQPGNWRDWLLKESPDSILTDARFCFYLRRRTLGAVDYVLLGGALLPWVGAWG